MQEEIKPLMFDQEEVTSEQIQTLATEICDTLKEFDLSAKGQISKILNGMLANSTTYATLSFLTPSLGPINGVIASSVGATVNTATDKAVGYSKGWGLKESANTLLKIIQGVALSEGVRGVGGLIHNQATGFMLGMVLSGLVESAWFNEAGKGGVARDRLKKLEAQIKAYQAATGNLFQETKQQSANTSPVKNIVNELPTSPSVNRSPSDNIALTAIELPEYNQQDLINAEQKIIELLDKMGGLSTRNQLGKTSIGFALNSGTFIALTYLTPGLGMFNGAIASAVGSITHLIVDKVTGNDRGIKLKSGIRTFDGIGVSQGTRSLLDLVTEGHLTANFVVNAIVPPLMQSVWFNEASKRSTADSDFSTLKQLMTKHAQIASALDTESPFAEMQSSMKVL